MTDDPAAHQTRVIFAKADALWSRFSCPGTAGCCQFRKTGLQPWLWPSEWRVLTRGEPAPPPRADGSCPFLDSGNRCSRYSDRPMGCRTYFCHRIKGPRQQPVQQMDALLTRLERLNLDEDEQAQPKPLLDWLK
jgi:Fe-S-cluster containining protein